MASARYPDNSVQANPAGSGSAQYGYSARWVPPNLAAVPFWLDGFDADLAANVSFPANDTPVGAWKNKGSLGAAADMLQATLASKPLFKTSGINGHPTVFFTAGVSTMAATVSAVAGAAARHWFWVITVPAVTTSTVFVSRSGEAYCLRLGNDSSIVETNTSTTTNQIPAAPATGAHIIEMSFDGVTTNNLTFVIDGVSKVVTNGVGVGVGAEGGAAGMSMNGFGGHDGEFICYSAVQSAAVALEVRRGLSQKWGIAVS